jgi:hypothetical protein
MVVHLERLKLLKFSFSLPSLARGEGFKPPSLDGRSWGRVKSLFK